MMKRILVILFFCLLFGYILLFPRNLSKELIFIPSWAVDIGNGAATGTSDPAVPFKLDGKIGYLSKSGDIAYIEDVMHEAEISESLFINYSSVSRSLVMRSPEGEITGNIITESLPFFIEGRFFTVSPDRMTISEFSSDGELLWRYSPGAVITSADANADRMVLGLLDGTLLVIDETGNEIYSFFSTDSRYSIIYGCAISSDGSRVAAVTGLFPQLLIQFEAAGDGYIPVYRSEVRKEYRRNIFIKYSYDGRLLYLENPGGLAIIKSESGQESNIEIPGRVAAAGLFGMEDLSFIIFSGDDFSRLRVMRPDTGRIADFILPPGDVYFYPSGNCIYAGTGGIIVRYDIIEG